MIIIKFIIIHIDNVNVIFKYLFYGASNNLMVMFTEIDKILYKWVLNIKVI